MEICYNKSARKWAKNQKSKMLQYNGFFWCKILFYPIGVNRAVKKIFEYFVTNL